MKKTNSKNLKKIFSIIIILIMMLSFTACSDDGGSNQIYDKTRFEATEYFFVVDGDNYRIIYDNDTDLVYMKSEYEDLMPLMNKKTKSQYLIKEFQADYFK